MPAITKPPAASATPTAAAGGDDNPSADDLGGDDRGGQRAFDDNPTGDDATATATAGAGRNDDAAAAFGDIVRSYSLTRIQALTASARVHYFAGVAFERAGLHREAMAEYDEFLELWVF